MGVSLIATKLSGLIGPASRYVSDLLTPGDQQAPPETTAPSGGGRNAEALHDLVRKYDVHNMSPGEYSDMLQELYDGGAITTEELRELSGVRQELDIRGVDPGERIDVLKLFSLLAGHAEQAQSGASGKDGAEKASLVAQVDSLRSQLDWLNRFAAIQAGQQAAAVDLVA